MMFNEYVSSIRFLFYANLYIFVLEIRQKYKLKVKQCIFRFIYCIEDLIKEQGNGISRQNLNEKIETLYLAPKQFCH